MGNSWKNLVRELEIKEHASELKLLEGSNAVLVSLTTSLLLFCPKD